MSTTDYFSPQNYSEDLLMLLGGILSGTPIEETLRKILSACLLASDSDFDALIITPKGQPFQIITYDPFEFFENTEVFQHEILYKIPALLRMLEISPGALETWNIPPELRFEFVQKLASIEYVIHPVICSSEISAILLSAKLKEKFSAENKASIANFASLISFIFNFIKKAEAIKTVEAKESLSKRLDIMGKVAGAMAHDINNLLSGIFGSLELLNFYIDNPEANRLIEIIRDCALKAKDLTRGLLSYGKTSQKKWEKIHLEKLLFELKEYATQTFPKTVDFSLRIDRDINSMNGNYVQLYQVLLNLCVNAKEALNNNTGAITVSARNLVVDSCNATEFPSLEFGKYIHLVVEDNGTGIKPDDIPNLFEPYFTTKRTKGGAGLGLYIVYSIVQAHQGTIEVESLPSKGTRFDCYFPASLSPQEKVKNSKIIMLIEDEVVIGGILSELFESHDYDVINLTSASEAIKVLTEELKVSVIITDYHLNDMDGFSFTTQVRELGIQIPVIVTTGDSNVLKSNIFAPFCDVKLILKPFEFEDLLNTVQQIA
jgi:signal transduction histidine kinase/CheY-like chemotaxis protein